MEPGCWDWNSSSPAHTSYAPWTSHLISPFRSFLIWKMETIKVLMWGSFKICPWILCYSSLHDVELNVLPHWCGLHLVTHFKWTAYDRNECAWLLTLSWKRNCGFLSRGRWIPRLNDNQEAPWGTPHNKGLRS